MSRIFHSPWLHFLFLGAALFLLQRQLYPPPLPSVGPLPEARLETLRRQWFATTGRMASDAQLEGMIEAELDREVLFREALDLDLYRLDPIVQQRLVRNMRFLQLDQGRDDETLFREALRMELHLGDEVVKRRLVQVMEQLLLAKNPPAAPTEAELHSAFESRREELLRPPRYSLRQVFLPRKRAGEADALLAKFRSEAMTPEDSMAFSSPFLPGYRFALHSPAQLARQFGAAFVYNLDQLAPQPQSWVGPVQSTYGVHLVWVDANEPAREPALDEVAEQLRRDLELEKRRASLAEAVADLRAGYEVLL